MNSTVNVLMVLWNVSCLVGMFAMVYGVGGILAVAGCIGGLLLMIYGNIRWIIKGAKCGY